MVTEPIPDVLVAVDKRQPVGGEVEVTKAVVGINIRARWNLVVPPFREGPLCFDIISAGFADELTHERENEALAS